MIRQYFKPIKSAKYELSGGCRSDLYSCSFCLWSLLIHLILADLNRQWKESKFLFTQKNPLIHAICSFLSPTFPKSTKSLKSRRRELTEEENDEIREAFELFDNDKDNELDYHEFKVKIFDQSFSFIIINTSIV